MVAKGRRARDKGVGCGGNGVALRENSPIDTSAHLGDNGCIEKRIKVGSIVGWRQWWGSVATMGQMTNRVGRHKVVVAKRSIVIVVFVG